MTMLPDIDQTSYDDYEKERLRQELKQKQQSFTLQQAISEKIAGLQSIVGGAAGAVGGAFGGATTPPEPAPSPEPAPEPPAEPAPAPEPVPVPEPPPSDVASQAPPVPEPAPAPAPVAEPAPAVPSPAAPPRAPGPSGTPPSSTVAPPRSSASQADWIGSALGAVQAAGGDVATFASKLRTDGDLIGSALGAASAAGADIAQFASRLPELPKPTPSPGAAIGTGAVPGGDLVDYARGAAQRAGIDPDIFVRQIQQESGFNPGAKSPAGAIGIAQFMPATAAGRKVDPTDPYAALDAAAQMNAENLQRYGSYDKMLAAYNAGGGAVERYGGVPPFEETQRYVKNILGGAGEAVRGAVGGAVNAVRGAANQISQFGNPQLTNDEAYAACGPAAAVRFASMYGRNPTLREATDLAKTVGWTAGSGMAGLSSEKSLMDKLGVATKMVLGGQWDVFAKEALSGNPVTISTPGHYFFADGYDPQSGAFHVGRSGSDLRQGSEWMTPQQMENVMGVVQGGLLADNPQVPSPSQATTSAAMSGTLGSAADQPSPSSSSAAPPLTDIYGRLTPAATGQSRTDDLYMGGMQAASVGEPQALTPPEAPSQNPVDKLKSAFGDFLDSLTQQPAGQPAQSQAIPSDTLTNPLGSRYAEEQPTAALTGQPAAGIADTGERGGLDIAGQIGSTALQSAQERLGGIQRLETGNPLIDVPAVLPTGAASALGTAVRAGMDVSNELFPSTHIARLEEGTAGEVRRDPAYNAALNKLWDLNDQLYNAPSGEEQNRIRQEMREVQDYMDRRSQEVLQAAGVKDVLSAYEKGMQSPDRETAETIGALATLPLAGLSGAEMPAAARVVGRLADPLAAALPEVPGALRGAGAAGAATPRAALDIAGGAAGAYGGWQSDENAPLGERVGRATVGGLAGVGAAEAGQYGLGKALSTAAPRTFKTGSAGLDAIYDMYGRQDIEPSLADKGIEALKNTLGLDGRLGSIDTAIADRYAAINQMTGRAKEALGSAFTPDMDAEAYVATFMGRGGRTVQRIKDDLQPAFDLIRDSGGDLEDLNTYRKLQRDLEVANLQGGTRTASAGVGSAAQAQSLLDDLETYVGPDRWAKLVQADGMLNAAQVSLLKDRVASGLISPELAAELMRDHPHYNPTVFMKHLDEGYGGATSGSPVMQTTSNLVRQLAKDGAADDTEKPLRSLIRHFVQNDVMVNRNDTARAILRAAMNDPETAADVKKLNPMRMVTGPEVAGPGGAASTPGGIASVMQRRFGNMPGAMSVYEDGKRQYYEVPKGLEAAVKGLDAQGANAAEKVLNMINKPLRWGATAASPPFLVTNALADAVTTFIREGPGTAARIPMGWYSAAKQNDLYKEYARSGGLMESLYQRSPQDLDKLVEDTGGLLINKPGDVGRIAKDALSLQWIRRAGEVIEQGPRLAAFERHLAAGESPIQAAQAGRRVTVDFQRGGEAIRQANMVSLFLNARVQGELNMARTLRDDPKGAAARLTALAAMNAASYAYNRNYPEYWDVPKSVRDSSMVWMLPGSEKDPNGPGYKKLNYIAVPLREWSTFTAPLNYALSKIDQEHGDDPRTWQDFAKDVAGNVSPMPGEDVSTSAAALVPAPIRTPIETAANKRFYSGSPIIPAQYQDLPPSQQWNDRTSLLGRKLGDALGISPMMFDFQVTENLGGLGRTALGASNQVTNWATRAAGGTAPEDTSIPVLGGLLSGVVRNYGGQIASNRYDKLDQLMGQFQEPVADSIRQMPEYQGLTRDAQDSAVRVAQQELKSVLQEELGIEKTPRDLGLPGKYQGVDSLQEEAKIDNAIAKWNAWQKNPSTAREPTIDEAQLALAYDNLRNPLYKFAQQQVDQRNQEIRASVDKALAGAGR